MVVGRGTTSGGIPFGDVLIASMSFPSDMSCLGVVVSTPSATFFGEESPSRGLSKVVGGGRRRLSGGASGGNEKDDWVDVGIPSMILG